MTIVIGLAPNERGAAAVHLGSMLSRSVRDDLVVVTVVPTPWPPNPTGRTLSIWPISRRRQRKRWPRPEARSART